MGKMDDLAKKLEEQRKQQGTNRLDAEKQKTEWLANLQDLLGQIRQWLDPLSVKELVTIVDGQMELDEPLVGRYSAPALTIRGQGWSVDVRPAGRFIIGARGRVDLVCGARSLMLLLMKDGWVTAVRKDRGFDYHPLSEEAFAEVVEEITA